jgi:hypothetical protein
MPKELTRKEFLSNTSKYAIGAIAGVAGLNALSGGKILASPKDATWPWPYEALDPEDVRIRAHHLYWNDKDCCSGVFGGLVEALREKIGDPWTNMPIEVMLFGRGGGVGWGTLCGAINGGAALISLVVPKADSGKLINELWGWYCTENLPSDAANQAAVDGKYIDKKYNDVLPQSVGGSVLCHASVSQWCMIAKKKVSDIERKERCARLAGDIAAKTTEILNAYFAGTFTSTYVTDEYAAQCQTCHGPAAFNTVMTQMDCEPCHGDPHSVTGLVESDGSIPSDYQLSQNYPNPFNPSTKIQFAIPKNEKVSVIVYDIMGQEVKRLIDHELLNPGKYTVEWNGTDNFGKKVTSGIYFARMTAGQYQFTRKMNLAK